MKNSNKIKGITKDHHAKKDRVDEVIYCFWTDDNPITPARSKCLETMKQNLGVRVDFLDAKAIGERILPDAPLHPGYQYLSAVHKSDYLRCYFLHHFGGGYADIKSYSKDNNWKECFQKINKNKELEIVGSREIMGGSAIPAYNVPEVVENLLSMGFFIVRPQSYISSVWYTKMLEKMDESYQELKNHPAPYPFARKNDSKSKGYPLGWSELLGDILHPILYNMHIPFPYKKDGSLNSGWQQKVAYR